MSKIEEVNKYTIKRFRARFFTNELPVPLRFTLPETEEEEEEDGNDDDNDDDDDDKEYYTISVEELGTMRDGDFERCYNMIKETSSDTYKNSEVGWSPAKKLREMRGRDMRYILVRQRRRGQGKNPSDNDNLQLQREKTLPASAIGSRGRSKPLNNGEFRDRKPVSDVVAFLSFMLTYEDGYRVIYCYELHVSARLRACGLGSRLMDLMEHVGRKVNVDKAMLTVFWTNEGALRFYQKRG